MLRVAERRFDSLSCELAGKAADWIENAECDVTFWRGLAERLQETERKFGTLMHDLMDERDRLNAALVRIANCEERPAMIASQALGLVQEDRTP
jgi:hypothetical protein